MNITEKKMATIIEMFRSSQLKAHIPSISDAGLDDEVLGALIRTLYAEETRRPSNLSPRKIAKEVRTLTARLGDCDVQIFPVEEVRTLQKRARECGPGEFRGPDGWSRASCDPMKLLDALPSLHIRPGWVLQGYQKVNGEGAWGLVCAMPEDVPPPEPAACMFEVEGQVPRPYPHEALNHPMEAIQGDGSAWSYLSASLLSRELQDFGALGEERIWVNEKIVDRPPGYEEGRVVNGLGAFVFIKLRDWEQRDLPDEWRPHVRQGFGLRGIRVEGDEEIKGLANTLRKLERGESPISVRFLTCDEPDQKRIDLEEDVYVQGQYVPTPRGYTVAKAPEP
jgi:hypothetical protein